MDRTKGPPEKNAYEIMARKLGIALESYVKELLEEYARKGVEIHIWDDEKGTFLYGSAKELRFRPKEILRTTDAKRRYNIKGDFDLLIITNKQPIVVEIKLNWTGLRKEDLDEISETAHNINGTAIIVIETGEPKIPLLIHAVKKGVILISGEASRLLSKKIKFTHW